MSLAGPVPPDWLPALVAFGARHLDPSDQRLCGVAADRAGRFSLRQCLVGGDPRRPGSRRAPPVTIGPSRLLALATLGVFAAAGGWFCRGLLWTTLSRLFDPQQGGLFMRRLVRLFSGGTVFEFIPGPPRTSAALDAADAAFVVLAMAAALGLVKRLRQDDAGRERCLAWAVALMLGSFYVVAGPAALAPHFERYGICLVAPVGVLLALGWSYWLGTREPELLRLEPSPPPRRRTESGWNLWARAAGVLLAAAAWLWLAYFYRDYFLVFGSTGGTSHVAFRTSAVEPKLAALQTIIGREQGD